MSLPPLTLDRALEILGVDAGATREERRRLFYKKRSLLKRKQHLAITPGLRAKYRLAIAELTLAFEALELASTEQDLESLEVTIPARAELDGTVAKLRAGGPLFRSRGWLKRTRIGLKPLILCAFFACAATGVVIAGLAWRALERDRAEASRVAAELQAQTARELTVQIAEQARLAALAKEAAAVREAKEERLRREAEASEAIRRQEDERRKGVERQARLRLVQEETKLETALSALRDVEAALASLQTAVRTLESEAGWPLEWSRRRLERMEMHAAWLRTFFAQHPARTHLRAATQLLPANDPDGAWVEIQHASDAIALHAIEPEERRYLDVGRPLMEWLTGPGDWPEAAYARVRADEPRAVERAVAQLKAELAYLDDRSRSPIPSDWRDRLVPLRKLAGATDAAFLRWQPRFVGAVRVTSVPSGAALVDENGMAMGTTPARFELMRGGSLSLTAFRKGFTPASVTATVGLDDEREVGLVLDEIPTPRAGRPYTIPGLGLGLVWIAPGTFIMGSPSTEAARAPDEGPPVSVSLTHGYWLGKYEVTQGEWVALMGNNPSHFKTIGLNGPVETVSWREANEFCRRLTERERASDRLPPGYSYTLPTEAQWEYACRAGSRGAYSGELDAMGWYNADGEDMSHVVGQKAANAWGLYDMHGNVWEWCLDWYADGYRKDANGAAVSPAKGSYRVSRGGSWNCPAENCRSALRRWLSPADRGNRLGFRLALSPVKP